MNIDDLYDSDFDSDFEGLVTTGKKIKVVYFEKIEEFKQSEKELNKNGGFNHDSNIVQYIIFKPVNN